MRVAVYFGLLALTAAFWLTLVVTTTLVVDEVRDNSLDYGGTCTSLREAGWDVSQHDCLQALINAHP